MTRIPGSTTIGGDGTSLLREDRERADAFFASADRSFAELRFAGLPPAGRWRRLRGVLRRERAENGVSVVRCRFAPPFPAAAGKRIAFVSDLHYRASSFPAPRLEAILGAIRDFSPDLILFGGDTVFDAETLDEIPPLLERFAALAPFRCAVTGNWEQGKTWIPKREWRSVFLAGGVELLLNERFRLPWLDLYGAEDPARGELALPAGEDWEAGKLRILLTHRPDTAIIAEGRGCAFHLAFTGHTHGGQWRIPLVGALWSHSLYGRRFDSGCFVNRESGARLIVGRGLGEGSLPLRFCCPRELMLAEFAAPAAGGGAS